jgi:hypothetical protein
MKVTKRKNELPKPVDPEFIVTVEFQWTRVDRFGDPKVRYSGRKTRRGY